MTDLQTDDDRVTVTRNADGGVTIETYGLSDAVSEDLPTIIQNVAAVTQVQIELALAAAEARIVAAAVQRCSDLFDRARRTHVRHVIARDAKGRISQVISRPIDVDQQ